MSDEGFLIKCTLQGWMAVDQIWSDGDAPENPTVEDVKRVIRDDPRTDHIYEWLGPDPIEIVSVNGEIV